MQRACQLFQSLGKRLRGVTHGDRVCDVLQGRGGGGRWKTSTERDCCSTCKERMVSSGGAPPFS